MSDNNKEVIYSDTPSPDLVQLQSKQLDLESGYLGKIFGGVKNAPANIAGLCLSVLLLAGVATIFVEKINISTDEYWKYSFSIITLILGYLFGKNSN